jgi:hypothetical protein
VRKNGDSELICRLRVREEKAQNRKERKVTGGAESMAGTPTLPTNREESGTHGKTPEKAAPPAGLTNSELQKQKS